MSAVPQSMSATSLDRRIQMLRTAMGPLIAAALEESRGNWTQAAKRLGVDRANLQRLARRLAI